MSERKPSLAKSNGTQRGVSIVSLQLQMRFLMNPACWTFLTLSSSYPPSEMADRPRTGLQQPQDRHFPSAKVAVKL
jgi:hypothetical protein